MIPSSIYPPIRIGSSDPVPPLGIGTWAWGDTFVWGFGSSYTEDDVGHAFRAAMDCGVRFFDTAEAYGAGLLGGFGRSESIVGRLQAEHEGPAPLIASKFAPLPWRLRSSQLLDAARASRTRLRVNRIDLYQVHFPAPPRSLETWANAMADAHEDGLIDAIGVSNCSVEQMQKVQKTLAERDLKLASNQIEFSLLRRKAETSGLLQACRDMGVVPIAYSPLTQGLLTGKYGPDSPLPGVRGWQYNRKLGDLGPFLEAYTGIAHEVGSTPAQLALAWTMAKGTLTIPGAKNAEQAAQNAHALKVELTEQHVEALDRLAANAPIV